MARRSWLALTIIWPAVLVGCSSAHVDGTVTAHGMSARVLSVSGPPYGGPYGHGLNQVPILAATSVTDLCGLTVGLRDVAILEVPPPFPLSGASPSYGCWGNVRSPVPSLLLAIETETNCVNTGLQFALASETLNITGSRTDAGCAGTGSGGTGVYYQPELSLVAIPLSQLPKALLTVTYDSPASQTFVDLRHPLPETLDVATRATEVDAAIGDAAGLAELSPGVDEPDYRDRGRHRHVPVLVAMGSWSDPGLGCLEAAGQPAVAATAGYTIGLADEHGSPPVTMFRWGGGRLVWCGAWPIPGQVTPSGSPALDPTTASYLAAMHRGQSQLRKAWLDGLEPALGGTAAATRWVTPGLASAASQYLEAVGAQSVPVGLTADAQLKQALSSLIAKTDHLIAESEAQYAADAAAIWRPIDRRALVGPFLYGPTFQAVVDAETAIGSGPPRVTGLMPASGPRQGGNEVEVMGANFQYGATVWFGDLQAPASGHTWADDANVLFVYAPSARPGSMTVVVRTAAGWSPSTPAARYTYY